MNEREGNICRYLDWDSDHFGLKIAILEENAQDEETCSRAFSWCREREIQCLYFLCGLDDPTTVRTIEKAGFNLVDVRMTFETNSCRPPPDIDDRSIIIRPVRPADISALKQTARKIHRFGRFHFDHRFEKEKADRMYESWIEKSCRGWADMVLVAEILTHPVGYISCHVRGERDGQIGLVGVDESARKKGVGRSLVNAALEWFQAQGIGMVWVVTQGRNLGAQRLYQRMGFVTRSVQLWYHKWFS